MWKYIYMLDNFLALEAISIKKIKNMHMIVMFVFDDRPFPIFIRFVPLHMILMRININNNLELE